LAFQRFHALLFAPVSAVRQAQQWVNMATARFHPHQNLKLRVRPIGSRLAVVTAQDGDQPPLPLGEAGHVGSSPCRRNGDDGVSLM
jgi:hypothetical protein